MLDGRLHKVRFDEMEVEIRKKCIENGIHPQDDTYGIDWKSLDIAPPNRIEEKRALAKNRNGNLFGKN